MFYIRKIRQYREENRPIIYIDETYINSSHTTPRAWSDESVHGLHAPIGKGPRLIVVNALSESGFLPNSLLIFKSGSTSGDYHKEMNSENYVKWLREKLIPNLPNNSVIVVDNASYHNATVEKTITLSNKKCELQQWLNEKNIFFSQSDTKVELYSKIKQHRPQFKQYVADTLLAAHGHTILRLPPYHPELNPIEKMWGIVKNWVATHNVTFKLDDVRRLAEQKFAEDYANTARALYEKVKQIEEHFIGNENFLDIKVDELIIKLDGDSDDSDVSSDSD